MSTVLLERLSLEVKSLNNQISRAMDIIGLPNNFNKAKAVFIKPNLTYPVYRKGVTTRKEFVEEVVKALRKINNTTRIYIGEGEGGYNSFSMTEAMETMGFYEIEKSYPNVKIINLSHIDRKPVELSAKGKTYIIELPSVFFDEIDFSITCPLPKVHCMTKVTLAYKNQWGCLPDVMRLKNHYVFDEIIAQVCEKLKFRYAFLDGKYGLDNNGPMVGDPVEVNWFAASDSLGAFDIVISRMMGFDWKQVGHLKQAMKMGYIPEENQINVIGNIDELKRKFRLRRNFWNYPALIAFNSRPLTRLVYLSRWSDILHDIMYTFRRRPIDK